MWVLNIVFSSSVLKCCITKWKRNSFKRYWPSLDIGLETIRKLPFDQLKYKKYFISFSRLSIKRLIGLFTVHCTLNKHVHAMRISSSPLCYKCGEETVIHFLCPWAAYMLPILYNLEPIPKLNLKLPQRCKKNRIHNFCLRTTGPGGLRAELRYLRSSHKNIFWTNSIQTLICVMSFL